MRGRVHHQLGVAADVAGGGDGGDVPGGALELGDAEVAAVLVVVADDGLAVVVEGDGGVVADGVLRIDGGGGPDAGEVAVGVLEVAVVGVVVGGVEVAGVVFSDGEEEAGLDVGVYGLGGRGGAVVGEGLVLQGGGLRVVIDGVQRLGG